MERVKYVLNRLLYPGAFWIFILAVLTVALLAYCFTSGGFDSWFAYTAYALSAYDLAAVAAGIPCIIGKAKALIHRNKYSNRFVRDAEFRAKVSLYRGLFINLLFVAFKLTACVIYDSFWFGAAAVYYAVLSVIRFILLHSQRKISSWENHGERYVHGFHTYRLCGYLMFVLNAAITGIIFQMIWQNRGYQYPWLIVYIFAIYTFYCMTMAIINLIKYRKIDNPVMSAAKMLSFAGALMSILTLQTAMLAEFGSGEDSFRQIANAATGGSISVIVFVMAIFMIVRANKRLKI